MKKLDGKEKVTIKSKGTETEVREEIFNKAEIGQEAKSAEKEK